MSVHERTGVPCVDDLEQVAPSPGRLARGAVAVLECFQEIPCDPCSYVCRRAAITVVEGINSRPHLDSERCDGCGVCVTSCPGLVIVVIDHTYSPEEALVKIPYEFLPMPAKGDSVVALDREGLPVGSARVVHVQAGSKQHRTAVVWLAVARGLEMTVRHMRVEAL